MQTTNHKSSDEPTRKNGKRVSLHPLEFEEAMKAWLGTKPPERKQEMPPGDRSTNRVE